MPPSSSPSSLKKIIPALFGRPGQGLPWKTQPGDRAASESVIRSMPSGSTMLMRSTEISLKRVGSLAFWNAANARQPTDTSDTVRILVLSIGALQAFEWSHGAHAGARRRIGGSRFDGGQRGTVRWRRAIDAPQIHVAPFRQRTRDGPAVADAGRGHRCLRHRELDRLGLRRNER